MSEERCVVIRTPGDPDVLEIARRPARAPGPGEVRVAVAAAGLNRADLLQRRGVYPAPPGVVPDVPGLEYAGIVEALGDGVSSARVGDRVMGIVGGGAMSTRVVVHERELVRVPDAMALERAAAIPEVFFTAFDALFAQAALVLGETVLVHAAGSGVGTAALQLAAAAGATVIGTSRSADKLARARELGLAHGIVTTDGSFAARVSELTGGRMADVVLDTVGASYLEENVRSLASKGRVVVVGLLSGVSGTLPLGLLLAKRATVRGTVLRSRPLEEKVALARAFEREVVPLFASGRLVPVVDDVVPMTEIRAAHRRLEANESFGKIVLTW